MKVVFVAGASCVTAGLHVIFVCIMPVHRSLHAVGRHMSGTTSFSCAVSATSAQPVTLPASGALAQQHRGANPQQRGPMVWNRSPSVSRLLTAAAPGSADSDGAGRQAVATTIHEQEYGSAPLAHVCAIPAVLSHAIKRLAQSTLRIYAT